jgi:hypothetical protein
LLLVTASTRGAIVSAVRREILLGIVAALREDPTLARELRELLGVAASEPKAESAQLFMRVRAYAARVSLGERTIWATISRDLPTVGQGRSRRVDVGRADAWLRDEHAAVDDAVERSARASARHAARARG